MQLGRLALAMAAIVAPTEAGSRPHLGTSMRRPMKARHTAQAASGSHGCDNGRGLHVRDPERSASSEPRAQQCINRLKPRPRAVSVTDECTGLKQQIGTQARCLKEAVEFGETENAAYTRSEALREALEERLTEVTSEMTNELCASISELRTSKQQLAELVRDRAAAALEWSAERDVLSRRVSLLEREYECSVNELQDESAAFKDESAACASLRCQVQGISEELRSSSQKHRASQHFWERMLSDAVAVAEEDRAAAAFEWATERDARLLAKDANMREIRELRDELNTEVLQSRTSAFRYNDSHIDLESKLQVVSQERDSLKRQLSELRRKSAEDYTQLLYYNRVQ